MISIRTGLIPAFLFGAAAVAAGPAYAANSVCADPNFPAICPDYNQVTLPVTPNGDHTYSFTLVPSDSNPHPTYFVDFTVPYDTTFYLTLQSTGIYASNSYAFNWFEQTTPEGSLQAEGTITTPDTLSFRSYAPATLIQGTYLLEFQFEGNSDPQFGLRAVDTVNPVPLPAALPLFCAGLAGLGALGWRKARGKRA